MRISLGTVLFGIVLMLLSFAIIITVVNSQPAKTGQLKNAYYPYSVETSIKDR